MGTVGVIYWVECMSLSIFLCICTTFILYDLSTSLQICVVLFIGGGGGKTNTTRD